MRGIPISLRRGVSYCLLQFKTPLELETQVATILSETALPPHLLELELTESALMQVSREHNDVLLRLRKAGLRIAIDDFGSGYSSLAMLHKFPLDTIKIDRSFMRGIVGTAQDTGLADAIIAMGKSLSLTVVAQGVETKEQAEHLRLHECNELQGFYFKRPLPADEFTRLLHNQAPDITYSGMRLDLKPV